MEEETLVRSAAATHIATPPQIFPPLTEKANMSRFQRHEDNDEYLLSTFSLSEGEHDRMVRVTRSHNLKDSEAEDKFEDAHEIIPVATTMSLLSSLEECTTGLYLFLNNRFSDAINLIHPWSKNSSYHALIYSMFMVVKAILTFEPQDIQIGMNAAKEALKT